MSSDFEIPSGEVIDLTPEQARQALAAGTRLYEMAVEQRNIYRAMLAAAVAEYGTDFMLTLPADAVPSVEALFQITRHPETGTVEVRLVEDGS